MINVPLLCACFGKEFINYNNDNFSRAIFFRLAGDIKTGNFVKVFASPTYFYIQFIEEFDP